MTLPPISHGGPHPPSSARERPPRATLLARAEFRFGIVLVLLLATFLQLMVGSSSQWARPVTVALIGTTLVAALFASGVSSRLRLAAEFASVVAFIIALVAATLSWSHGEGTAALLNVALVAVAPVAIARSALRRGVIDVQTVMAALCVYVLLGMLWAFAYTAIGSFGSSPFFVQITTPTSADYLYFSFITQTTVGYGDLSAEGNVGRAVAVLEALIGQLYLVTVVAVVISRLTPRQHREPPTEG